MTGKGKAAAAWQGNDGKLTSTKPLSEVSVTAKIITADKDWNGHTVTTSAGLQIVPDSIIMDALSSADSHTHKVDRSRFMVAKSGRR